MQGNYARMLKRHLAVWVEREIWAVVLALQAGSASGLEPRLQLLRKLVQGIACFDQSGGARAEAP